MPDALVVTSALVETSGPFDNARLVACMVCGDVGSLIPVAGALNLMVARMTQVKATAICMTCGAEIALKFDLEHAVTARKMVAEKRAV